MKIVVDTNVVISALFFGGKPRELLKLVLEQGIEAYASPSILEEYNEIMERIAKKYPHKAQNFSIHGILSHFKPVHPRQEIKICRDSADDKFIECALEAHCPYIVSGDDDLLSLKRIDSVEVITVSDFFTRYNSTLSTT